MKFINDPTLVGWLICLGYFAVAVLCVLNCIRSPSKVRKQHPGSRFWLTLALLLAALGFNKQLDLHTHLIAIGKQFAISFGWYENRIVVQTAFSLCVLLALFGLIALLVVLARRARGSLLAMMGLVLVAMYAGLRAAYFNHFDEVLGVGFSGIRHLWTMEFAGLILMGLAAVRHRACHPDTGQQHHTATLALQN